MASKAALVKSTPPAAPPPVEASASNAVDSTPAPAIADAPAPDTTSSSKATSITGVKDGKTPSSLPSITVRPRRGSSDEFGGTGSLGSIAGSAVGYGGSSVGYDFSVTGGAILGIGVSSNNSSHDKSINKDAKSNKGKIIMGNNKDGNSSNNSNSNSNNISSNNSNNISNNIIGILNNRRNLKIRTSPTGRRPFRKRKASVDFSFPALSIDDSDSSYSLSQLLPQHQGTGSAPKGPMAAAGLTVSSSSVLMLPSNANRSRFYSDLTIPESLLTPKNPGSSSSSKQQKQQQKQQQQQQQQQQRHKDNLLRPKEEPSSDHEKDQMLPSMDALPSMEDDALPPIDNDAHSLLLNHPHSPISNANQTNHSGVTTRKDRALSFASVHTQGHGVDRLDSLGVEATISASRIRKGSSVESDAKSHKSLDHDGDNSYDGTLGSQSHRFLMEAFLGDGTESLVLNPSQRERLGSFDVAAELTGNSTHAPSVTKVNHGNNHNSNILISRERLNSIGGRRNRLESWGGMSDLSVGNFKADQNLESLGVGIFAADNKSHGNNSGSGGAANSAAAAAAPTDKTAALAATIYTSLANDVTAAANGDGNESVSSFLVHEERIPSRISVSNRDRMNSIASIGTDASALLRYTALTGDIADAELSTDVHTLIQATMSSVEDQLADLATAVEAVSKDMKGEQDSELSSTASPMIGAASDVGSTRSTDSFTGRPRSSSINSMLQISVDYDAVAAAVHAAEAAAGCLDLSAFSIADASSASSGGSQSNHKRRALPTQKKGSRSSKKNKKISASSSGKKRASGTESLPSAKRQCIGSQGSDKHFPMSSELKTPLPKSTMDVQEMEKLRERARAAAGYVPPAGKNSVKGSGLPPKKRSANSIAPTTPMQPPRPSVTCSGSNLKTPTISNTATSKCNVTPASALSSGTPASATKGQSSQKWESMFECLLQFIEDRKKEATAGMTEAQISEWIWDGNVPTTYKTTDGKALGRWVNNQRSAKSKGSLKEEREKRLVDAGLKWSVLASNSWNEMLEELRIYVADQNKQGKKWDGNVPTNYRIKVTKDKAKPFVKDDDEDKNLGRWVNRQRSMFQAGKLRKDRQLALEKIGLKWSMLATTSWESMFETLCEYIKEKQKGGNEWDGNVPANYRTEDNPPRALGRWINRQRSAYGKSKLKPEYVAKLNEIGLKWSIHERRPTTYHQYKPDASKSSSTLTSETAKSTLKTNAAKATPTVVQSAAEPTTSTVQNAKKPTPTVVQSAVTTTTTTTTVQNAAKPVSMAVKSPTKPTPTAVQSAAKPTPMVLQNAAKPSATVAHTAAKPTATVVQTAAKPTATVVQTAAKPTATIVQTAANPTTTVTVTQTAATPASIVVQNAAKSTTTAVQNETKPTATLTQNAVTPVSIAVQNAATTATTAVQNDTKPTATATATVTQPAATPASIGVQNAAKPTPSVEQNTTKPKLIPQNTAAATPTAVAVKLEEDVTRAETSTEAVLPVGTQSVGSQQQTKIDSSQSVATPITATKVEAHSKTVSSGAGTTVSSNTQPLAPKGEPKESSSSTTDPKVVVESNKPPPIVETNGKATTPNPTPFDMKCLAPIKEEEEEVRYDAIGNVASTDANATGNTTATSEKTTANATAVEANNSRPTEVTVEEN